LKSGRLISRKVRSSMVTFTRIRVSSMLLSAVLGVGDDVALRTADEARCHHADMYRILTVGFLEAVQRP